MITASRHFGDIDPEVALMLRVRDGSSEAFDELVLRYSPWLIRRFSTMWGLKEFAEDLSQEVLLRIYRARHAYVPAASLRTWIGRIALNVARNAVRRMRRHPDETESRVQRNVRRLVCRTTDMSTDDDVVSVFLTQEQSVGALALLERLPERQRTVLRLVSLEGKSIATAAREMALSTGALKSLLARARTSLRREFRRVNQNAPQRQLPTVRV